MYKSALEHRVVKSGEEWRWLSEVQIEVRAAQPPLVSLDTVEVRSTRRHPDRRQVRPALPEEVPAEDLRVGGRVAAHRGGGLIPRAGALQPDLSAMYVCVEDYSLQNGLQAADLCILLGYDFAGKKLHILCVSLSGRTFSTDEEIEADYFITV